MIEMKKALSSYKQDVSSQIDSNQQNKNTSFKSLSQTNDQINKFNNEQSLTNCYLSNKNIQDSAIYTLNSQNSKKLAKIKKLDKIRSNIIGINSKFYSPLGFQVEAVYVDHTATNRPYKTIQTMIDYAKKYVANPHTQFSQFGKYSTGMVRYSQISLLNSFNTTPQIYVALPAGSGSTGAIQKTIKMLKTIEAQDKFHSAVFVTPYEHHSNLLPWVEYYNDVKVLKHDEHMNLQFQEIFQQLMECRSQKIIVTVSAASNVTSKITKLKGLNQTIEKLKKYKKIIFCVDCAAYASHNYLDLKAFDQIDFVFLSPHKNLGGVQSCGVLIARKSLISFYKPTFPGGGTVNFVKGYTKQDIMYSDEIFDRQIAGTPPFLGFYRAALSFQLLYEINYEFIHQNQQQNKALFMKLINQINKKLQKENYQTRIQLYGDKNMNNRANIITFNFKYGQLDYVQHSFASLIFTDVFGIQLRSGCFCAGPYGMKLLNIEQQLLESIQEQVRLGILKVKPGYLRLDLSFYLKEYEIIYLTKAIQLIAKYWKKMQKLYTICNNGQIQRLKFEKDDFFYSLNNFEKAGMFIYNDLVEQQDKLSKRQLTLKKQLENGERLLQNPIQFMKLRNNKQKLQK